MKLAIQGGTPAVNENVPAWPPLDEPIRKELQQLFDSGQWGVYEGEVLERMTVKLCQFFNRDYAWPCSSGTVGIELALRGLRVNEGEVVIAGYDFPGNFRAVEAVGAFPVLTDVSESGWTVDLNSLERACGEKTRAIIVSHLHGQLAPVQAICELAANRGLFVIEDACQAPGARIDQQPVGRFGNVSVLSFGGSKLLTAGRGGAVLSNDENVLQRIRIFCERGNNAFPLSQLQAAAVLPQLETLETRTQQRMDAVERLLSASRQWTNIRFPTDDNPRNSIHAFYKLPFLIDTEHRDFVIDALLAEGVDAGQGFRGFSRRAPKRCRIADSLVHCERAARQTVLLHHPFLIGSSALIDQTIAALAKVEQYLAQPSE